jgi:hypothetical protein
MSTGDRPGPQDGQTFADVLNGFSFGNVLRRRKSSGPAEPTPPQLEPEPEQAAVAVPDEEAHGAASPVRAYTWTGGRTRSHHQFAVETLVTTADPGPRSAAATQPDHRTVLELCERPRSVAEVAALLSVPWGVAKVLLGDMAERGLIVVHRTAAEDGEHLDVSVVERVLAGLRRL